MKAKVSLSIEKDLIPKSKQFAKRAGMSLSQLVELLLRETIEDNGDAPTFSQRWRGKFASPNREEVRFKKLKDRYGL